MLLMKNIFFCAFLCLCCMSTVLGREVIAFNEGWEFKKGPFPIDVMRADSLCQGQWERVTLPHTWNANDMQVRANAFYQGVAYYRKSCFFPAEWKRKRLFLRFEGVGSCCEVYVNGKFVGTHCGAYSAFAVEIQGEVKFGQANEIVVKADNSERPDVIPVNHNLFGVYGGIYRPVTLIITEPIYIAVTDHASPGVYITQKEVSQKSAEVSVKVKLNNATLQPEPVVLENTIYDQSGRQVCTQCKTVMLSPQGMQSFVSEFKIKHPHLWHGRRDPYLYKVSTRLYRNGELADEVNQPLGLRKYEVIAGKGFYLNGECYPMYGVTRHQDWWQLGSALKNVHHDADLDMVMDIGATTVRFAHYQQSDYIYSRCDSLGLIVWAEIPFVNRVTGQEWENAHSQLRELIRQSFNHPSIYVWGLHNEVYQPHSYTAQLTRSLHDLAKTEDPDRYTVSVNGYGYMEHPVNMMADIQGMNRYFGWYEKKIKDIDSWVENLEKNYPTQKLMLTEYGADANLNHQTEFLGESLNWTKEFYPETFQTKMHEYQWSVIEKHPYIIASYLWNMFDFACPMWERGGVPARNMKGLVTFDREVKKDAYYWYKANWTINPVLYLTQRRNMDRETRETCITVYSNIGLPTLSLNGRILKNVRQGYTKVHYIFDEVILDEGENVVRAIVIGKNGEEYTDEVRWQYKGEKQRLVDSKENKNSHSGF